MSNQSRPKRKIQRKTFRSATKLEITFPFEDFESMVRTNRSETFDFLSNQRSESKSSMGKVVNFNLVKVVNFNLVKTNFS